MGAATSWLAGGTRTRSEYRDLLCATVRSLRVAAQRTTCGRWRKQESEVRSSARWSRGNTEARHPVREKFSMQPVRPEVVRQLADVRSAKQDPEVLARHRGEFVVPYGRKIVAHGKDASVVLAEAARITGRQVLELPLVGAVDHSSKFLTVEHSRQLVSRGLACQPVSRIKYGIPPRSRRLPRCR